MVPAGGLEPPHPKITDFESVVSTIPPRWLVKIEIIIITYLKVNNICRYSLNMELLLLKEFMNLKKRRSVMRVTSSMYYDSLYRKNNLNLNKELFDVNKQISSGLKIQYASDDVTTFSQTMRLDNEITTLTQLKKVLKTV